MTAKGIQLVRIGSRDERSLEFLCHARRAPVRIERAFVKMTKLDPIETIDLIEEPWPDGAAENVERMGRDGEDGAASSRPERAQFGKAPKIDNFIWRDVEDDDVGAFQAHFRRGNEQNSHLLRVGKHFWSIKDSVVQGDGENAKA